MSWYRSISISIGVRSLEEGAQRVSQVTEGREDVCLVAVGYWRPGATHSQWAGGKVNSSCIFQPYDNICSKGMLTLL
jgi:hypothetical protein